MSEDDNEPAFEGPPEVVIPSVIREVSRYLAGDDAIVASFVVVAFRASNGEVLVAKAAAADRPEGITRMGLTLRTIADQIAAGEYTTSFHATGWNSPGGDG